MKPLTHLFRQTLHRFWQAAGTKYVLVLVGVSFYLLWGDRYNWSSQQEVEVQIQELKADRDHYQRAIENLEYEGEQIQSDRETLERFGREHYYMKRSDEDVFVIVEE